MRAWRAAFLPGSRPTPGRRYSWVSLNSKRAAFCGDVLPTFVAPVEIGAQVSARMARRFLPGSRPTPGRRYSWVSTNSKRAAFSWRCATDLRRSGGGRSPGLCAHGAPLFVWIPAYAGTTRYLSLSTSKAHVVRDDVIPTFVAPAEAGVQAYARIARRLLPGSRPTPGRQRICRTLIEAHHHAVYSAI